MATSPREGGQAKKGGLERPGSLRYKNSILPQTFFFPVFLRDMDVVLPPIGGGAALGAAPTPRSGTSIQCLPAVVKFAGFEAGQTYTAAVTLLNKAGSTVRLVIDPVREGSEFALSQASPVLQLMWDVVREAHSNSYSYSRPIERADRARWRTRAHAAVQAARATVRSS